LVLALAGAGHAKPLTLLAALDEAAQHHLALAQAEADVAIARGELVGARVTPHNPELGVAVGPENDWRQVGLAWQVSLQRTFELGGKASRRIGAAKQRVDTAQARRFWVLRAIQIDVRRTFQLALVARAGAAATAEAEAVATDLERLTTERLERGASNQLELNVARAILGRARKDRVDAERRYEAERFELARAVGSDPAADLEPDGDLPTFPALAATEDAVASAAASRSDIAAMASARAAAAADLALARAQVTPDLTLGVSYGRSGGVDTALAVMSIPLPFLDRNQGGVATAAAAVTRAEVDEELARREAEREARAAYRAYAKARDAVVGFEPAVVAAATESLSLSRKSFEAGKIGLVELNVLTREVIDARRAWLESLTEAVLARHALELSGAIDLE